MDYVNSFFEILPPVLIFAGIYIVNFLNSTGHDFNRSIQDSKPLHAPAEILALPAPECEMQGVLVRPL